MNCREAVHSLDFKLIVMMDCLDAGRRRILRRCELLRRFMREDVGQDLIEYAFLAQQIGIVGILVLQGIRTGAHDAYASWMDPATGTPSLWEPTEPPAP